VVEKFVHAVKDAIVQLVLEDQKMLEDQEVDQVQEAEIDAQEADPDQVQEKELDAQDADKEGRATTLYYHIDGVLM
jgi:hypothetical protein